MPTVVEASLPPRFPPRTSSRAATCHSARSTGATDFLLPLPDRFSDGNEGGRPLFDRADPLRFKAADKRAWMEAGKKFQGGTLKGIASKLGYPQGLGVTALWLGPVWRQRPDLQTYQGYGIQNFFDVDPRFGTRQDLRDLVDAAHARGIYVLLDVIYNHTANNWFYDAGGTARDSLPIV